MSSLSSRAIAIVVALVILFLASTYYIGLRVTNEVELLGQSLIERDDVRVTRFDYDAGFFSGTLHYDFSWQPLHEDPTYSLLEELGLAGPQGLVLRGELPVKHGPWVGKGHGFALAGAATEFALPDDLRPSLPQYPGQKPALTISSALSFGGMVKTHAQLVDYKGRVLDQSSNEQVQLEFNGVSATFAVSTTLDKVEMDMRIPALSVKVNEDGQTSGMTVKKVEFNQAARAVRPAVWVGDANFVIGELLTQSGKDEVKFEDLKIKGVTEIKKDFLDNLISMQFGPVTTQINEQKFTLRGAEFNMSLRHIDLDAYAEIALLLQDSAGFADDFSVEQLDQLMESARKILVNKPVLAIDKFSLSVTGKDDLVTNLTLSLPGADALDLEDTEALLANVLRAVGVEMSAEMAVSALHDLMVLYLHANNEAGLSEADIKAAAKAAVEEQLAELRELPYVKVTDKKISAKLTLAGGDLQVNGEKLMSADEMAALISLAMLDFDFGGDDGLYSDDYAEEDYSNLYSEDVLDLSAAPLFARLQLQTDFYPDPYSVAVVAGGDTNLVTALDPVCLGYVNGEQPDVVVNFTAGQYGLSIYVDGAGADTTLAVHAPDGYWYCDDDYPEMGLDPGVFFETPLSGDYTIWVGTHDASNVDAVVQISERGVGVVD